eukprot:TRINITY_DN64266_c0_g1_i1.p1 TRINITY_DN64266_c0_g1~~TRINITY_DN64266_c0_g1_i1.p1  ORF type:complete len:549 (+),score=133.61 TRINITY_DN64266_c0_g1_i1:44-1648(+)
MAAEPAKDEYSFFAAITEFFGVAEFFGLQDIFNYFWGEREAVVNPAEYRGPGLHKSFYLEKHEGSCSARYDRNKEGQVGKGSFGTVISLTNKATKSAAVSKVIRKDGDEVSARNEIAVLQSLDHANILRMVAHFEDDHTFVIVLERLGGKDLQHEVESSLSGLSMKEAASCIRQVLMAVNYMHSLPVPIVHRDLKPANIMKLSRSRLADIKVIDFGQATPLKTGTDLKVVCGTPLFMAPEIFDQKYGKEVDIWAIGLMLYYVLTKQVPFPTPMVRNFTDLAGMVRRYTPSFPSKHGWSSCRHATAKAFITEILQQEPSNRPTASQALRSGFIVKNSKAKSFSWWRPPSKKLLKSLGEFRALPAVIKAILLMAATSMDQGGLAKMRHQFQAVDLDSDGTISLQELESLLARGGGQSNKRSGQSQEMAEAMNLGKNGRISFTEFAALWLHSRLETSGECLRHAFCVLDRDNDGRVSQADILWSLGPGDRLRMQGGCADPAAEVARIFPTSAAMDFQAFHGYVMDCQKVSKAPQTSL